MPFEKRCPRCGSVASDGVCEWCRRDVALLDAIRGWCRTEEAGELLSWRGKSLAEAFEYELFLMAIQAAGAGQGSGK